MNTEDYWTIEEARLYIKNIRNNEIGLKGRQMRELAANKELFPGAVKFHSGWLLPKSEVEALNRSRFLVALPKINENKVRQYILDNLSVYDKNLTDKDIKDICKYPCTGALKMYVLLNSSAPHAKFYEDFYKAWDNGELS